ncbi:DHA1 family inner membrane transport protein [Georgenia soli]|uniref:DHA1 family inner membrane transport protein n=1 Tax=Georgenia soli TaxID=638953 RepID=A0A2A9EJZ5_9MICO|nr:MFS transporter [Georgenia soli]PFG38560.1 DHA1 family inner membrane transport protein [Georgenia soli]
MSPTLTGVLQPRPLALALLGMAVGSFAIGTTEFATMGLLPQVAETFAATIPQAGHLVSAYALGVVVGAPAIVLASSRAPRTGLLVALALALAVGNALSALAPTLPTALAARFLAGVPHGAYFGIAAVVASAVSPPQRRARSVSLVMVGLTVATMLGVPLSTAMGQAWGWRSLYWLVTAVAVLAAVAIWRWVPPVAVRAGATARRELTALRSLQLWLAVATGAVGFGGMFAVYSYITPTMTEVAGIAETDVPWVLFVFGVGMTLGTLLGGRLADRSVHGSIIAGLVAMAVSLAAFAAVVRGPVSAYLMVLLVSVGSQLIGPALQTRLLDVSREGPSLGAALHHSALNIGNALGAWVGGVVIAAGLGYLAPAWAGSLLALAGLGVAVVAVLLERRSGAPGPSTRIG